MSMSVSIPRAVLTAGLALTELGTARFFHCCFCYLLYGGTSSCLPIGVSLGRSETLKLSGGRKDGSPLSFLPVIYSVTVMTIRLDIQSTDQRPQPIDIRMINFDHGTAYVRNMCRIMVLSITTEYRQLQPSKLAGERGRRKALISGVAQWRHLQQQLHRSRNDFSLYHSS
ncbi:hypothetical protein VTN77DRAFT_7739 [Rasamsonia byssochlamydoides]|uniref:uncharacterized protein n=1 Tax=Rasamsonia byssochlamydoides TaxID=89139 RepID=UPI0037444497